MMNRILACVWLFAALSAGAFVVTQDGKAASEIIIDATAEKPVVNAAAELRHWVKEISGAELNIVTTPTAGVERRIRLSCSADALAVFPDVAEKLLIDTSVAQDALLPATRAHSRSIVFRK